MMSSRGFGLRCTGVMMGALACLLVWSAAALAAGPPVVDGQSVSKVGYTTAILAASIDPGGEETTYRFEYGITVAYGSRVPLTDSDVGAGSVDVSVSQTVSDLQPGTAYHYRVVATSAAGTTDGPDAVLRTYAAAGTVADTCGNAQLRGVQSSSYLPDCRAYELVSPPDKEGGDALAAQQGETQSSSDGEAIKFHSLITFGDAQGITERGTDNLSVRSSGGWVTHGITPPQGSLPLGFFITARYAALSEDLSKAIFLGYTPVVSGHPNVEHAANLYLRTDPFSEPPGNYELLSDSVTPANPLPAGPGNAAAFIAYAGASADFSHIIFETYNDLTLETSGLSSELPKLYEWDKGSLHLAGVLPDGTPAEGSVAGRGSGGGPEGSRFAIPNWTLNSISRDGSRVIFTGPPFVTGPPVESPEVAPGGNPGVAGDLYMRIDGRETIKLNVSERSTPDPLGHKAAEVWGATPDGSKVFFTSRELLTDDASGASTPGSGMENANNLYMYDLNAPAGKHLTLISVDNEPNGPSEPCGCGYDRAVAVLADGISTDGSYVYFLGRDSLVSGQPPIKSPDKKYELYVWHDGTVRAIVEHNVHRAGSDPSWGELPPIFDMWFRMTPDGRKVAFVSGDDQEMTSAAARAGISPVPQAGQAFVYDYETDSMRCASCDRAGTLYKPQELGAQVTFGGQEGAGENLTREIKPESYGTTQYFNRALSDDGRYVFFDTMYALLPQDINGKRDVYEYDTQTDEVHLLSSGTCNCESTFADASKDGSDAFFTTRQPLVRGDVDDSVDMYDARVNGGIARQNEPPGKSCEGDDCQGPAKLAPVFSLPTSSTFAGVGNVPPALTRSVKSRAKALSNAQKLARALRVCRKKPVRKRTGCEAQARRRYGASGTRARKSRRVGL